MSYSQPQSHWRDEGIHLAAPSSEDTPVEWERDRGSLAPAECPVCGSVGARALMLDHIEAEHPNLRRERVAARAVIGAWRGGGFVPPTLNHWLIVLETELDRTPDS